MAYNKARAEKEWLEWKNKEETQLRELGVDEDTIQFLHTYDWEMFKADRNYRQRHINIGTIPEIVSEDSSTTPRSVEDFPAPLLPMIETISPFSTWNETLRTALIAP